MRNRNGAELHRLLTHARYEVLPTPSAEQLVLEHLPPGFTVTITASPSTGLDATLELAERLAAQGFRAVPHLAARMIRDRAELIDVTARLSAAGIRTIFVPAGDADPPAGDYPAALDLLADLHELGLIGPDAPFTDVGVTGYPESHPAIHDDLTVQAMWDKRRYATQIVSNLSFDPAVVQRWVVRMRARGITTPLLLGLPGPVDRTKLLMMATKIGVGESTRFLAKHRGTFARLAAPGGFTGERFLEKVVAALGTHGAQLGGLHVFTFNQIAETEHWRQQLLARLRSADQRGQFALES